MMLPCWTASTRGSITWNNPSTHRQMIMGSVRCGPNMASAPNSTTQKRSCGRTNRLKPAWLPAASKLSSYRWNVTQWNTHAVFMTNPQNFVTPEDVEAAPANDNSFADILSQ